MNDSRRKEIEKIVKKLESIKEDIDIIGADESESFENFPEQLQATEKGEEMERACNDLSEALISIDETIDNLNSSTQ